MLVIRLTRIGKKNQPSFRVVLTEKKNPVKGKFIEILGSYNPRLKTKQLKADRIKYWLSQGAQASPTVHNMLVSEKIIPGPKVKAWRPKKRKGETKPAGAAEVKPAGEQPKEAKSEAPAEAAPKETPAAVPAGEVKTEAAAEEKPAEAPVAEASTEESKIEEKTA
ncbi:MAG: small subunit ribosomal protein S16 [Parcubacteria group bacterium LiPW_39]|nr:MAG: small subunit ribosomal protein S16 [Parcubacteria group bacterium LiPW_39]